MANNFHTEWGEPRLESLADLAENLVYRLPGASDTLVRKTLQEVAREFVRDTECLASRRFVEVDSKGEAVVPPVMGGKTVKVREVFIDRRRLREEADYTLPAPFVVKLNPKFASIRVKTEPAAPERNKAIYRPPVNIMPSGGAVLLEIEFPEIFVVAVEFMGMFSEKLPVPVLEQHGDAICSGTLSRLFAMTGKPWSDPQQANDELVRYRNAMSEERMRHEISPDKQAIDTSEVL